VAKAARIQINGLKETRAALRGVSVDSKQDIKQAHRAAAEIVAKQAKYEVPRRSGALEASIRAAATQTQGKVKAGFARTPYAGPIHFGWPTRPNPAKGWRGGPIRPQPFIYEAADKRIDEVVGAYEKRVGEIIRKYGLD
jgi:hypothetical protein